MLSLFEQDILKRLLQEKIVTSDQYANLEKEVGESQGGLEDLLIKNKVVKEEDLTKIKGELIGVPYVNMEGKKIELDVLNLMSRKVAENYEMLIFDKVGNKIKVAMVDPRDFRAIEALKFMAQRDNFDFEKYIISKSGYQKAIKQYEVLGKEVEKVLGVAKEKMEKVEEELKETGERQDMEEIIKKAPVSKMVSLILKHAVDSGASDIHIEPMMTETRIRFRVDGVLKISLILPLYVHASVVSRIKVMSNLKIDETRVPQDGRIRQTINGKQIDFRISILPLTDNEKVVMRILDTSKGVPTIQQLGFRNIYQQKIVDNIRKPNGLLLITGPTGSGKSTTLYTVLNMLNEEGINISTLEDPVEYKIAGINQSQVHPAVGFTFASGLRALLRQDPNVIMVGEIRDTETGELAIHAALTGHVVFSTLHTNDAFGVVPRMIDMHIEPFLIASTLNLMLAQRLVRKICDNCKEETQLPKDLEAQMKDILKKIPDIYFKDSSIEFDPEKPLKVFHGRGCSYCNNTGYRGRNAISEILENTSSMKKVISEGCHPDDLKKEAEKQETISLMEDGVLKVLEGVTTVEEVMRVTKE